MQDWRSAFNRLKGAYSPATIRAYFFDLHVYESWCARSGLTMFPAAPEQICAFLDEDGLSSAPSTVRRRLYAIRKGHRLLNLPDPTHDEDVILALRRICRLKHIRPTQAKGMTEAFLLKFIATEPDTPIGLRNRVMMSLGYDLLTRRSELVALQDIDVARCPDGTYRFLIRRSKSDPLGLGRTAFCSHRTARLLEAWRAWRGPHKWLLCPVHYNKPVDRGLSDTTVRRVIRAAAQRCCSPELASAFSGHSMRVGGAQDLLKRGLDTVGIMRAGGWKSVSTLAHYLENADYNPWL